MPPSRLLRQRARATPRDIIDRIHTESVKAMQVAAVQERLSKVGSEPMPMSADEFARYFRDDVLATAKLMQQIGINPGGLSGEIFPPLPC